MKTKSVRRKSSKKSKTARKLTPGQLAHQVTWRILGGLKNIRKTYLQIGVLLAQVRDEKMYADLKHPDMESYAKERLNLGRSSLYNYLRIHDWAAKSHPEWLDPKTKGPKLDFSDVGDLMWIEEELSQPDISESKQAKLTKLQQKAMSGNLRQADLRKFRKPVNTEESGLKSLLSAIRTVRTRAKKMTNCPPEAVAYLDAAIEIIANESVLKLARLDFQMRSIA